MEGIACFEISNFLDEKCIQISFSEWIIMQTRLSCQLPRFSSNIWEVTLRNFR